MLAVQVRKHSWSICFAQLKWTAKGYGDPDDTQIPNPKIKAGGGGGGAEQPVYDTRGKK